MLHLHMIVVAKVVVVVLDMACTNVVEIVGLMYMVASVSERVVAKRLVACSLPVTAAIFAIASVFDASQASIQAIVAIVVVDRLVRNRPFVPVGAKLVEMDRIDMDRMQFRSGLAVCHDVVRLVC